MQSGFQSLSEIKRIAVQAPQVLFRYLRHLEKKNEILEKHLRFYAEGWHYRNVGKSDIDPNEPNIGHDIKIETGDSARVGLNVIKKLDEEYKKVLRRDREAEKLVSP